MAAAAVRTAEGGRRNVCKRPVELVPLRRLDSNATVTRTADAGRRHSDANVLMISFRVDSFRLSSLSRIGGAAFVAGGLFVTARRQIMEGVQIAKIAAVSVAIFFCEVLSGSSAADEQVDALMTKEALLSVYRPFSTAFQKVPGYYCRAHFEESGVSIKSTIATIKIYCRDQATRVDFVPSIETVESPARVRVVSPEKSFKLKRQGMENPFFITEVSGDALLNNYKQFKDDLRLSYPAVSPWDGFLDSTVESYVSRPDVELLNVERSPSDATVVQASFRRQATADDGTRIDQRVHFKFLTSRGWALSEFRTGSEDNYVLAQMQYAQGTEWPPVLASLVKKQVSGKSDIFKETYSVEEFDLEPQPKKLFRLSAFGLNDGIGSRGWMNTKWLISFNIVFLLALVAVLVYRRMHNV